MTDYKALYEQLLEEHNILCKNYEDLQDKYYGITDLTEEELTPVKINPYKLFIKTIETQTKKEVKSNIWGDSDFKNLPKLQANNAGIVGEKYIQTICKSLKINSTVNGQKTKKIGGGEGDGNINGKSVEIKTAHRGNGSPSFQHELGEKPWISDYMMFIDVDPSCIYLTIFKNFEESHYRSNKKCDPIFPTKTVTQRKGIGAFKLDTTVTINESSVSNGYAIKILKTTTFREIGKFINKIIK